MKFKNNTKRIMPALMALAALPAISIIFSGCESMSPEGADVFDAAAAKHRPHAVQAPAAVAPAPRPHYPVNGPVHPSDLPYHTVEQPMPIPVPVPRQ